MSKSAEEKQKDMGANLKGLPLTKSDLSIKIKTVKDHYSVYKTGTLESVLMTETDTQRRALIELRMSTGKYGQDISLGKP